MDKILKEMGNPKIGRGWNVTSIDLTTHEDCVIVQNRVWIPVGLQQEVAPILHLGHKCVDRMFKVASKLCYWVGMKVTLTDLTLIHI